MTGENKKDAVISSAEEAMNWQGSGQKDIVFNKSDFNDKADIQKCDDELLFRHEPKLVLRHEFKHYISVPEQICLMQRLKRFMDKDANSDSEGKYLIRSLYFDDADNNALYEKLDGVNNREKFRLRFYNNDCGFIKLERKSEINGLCGKDALIVSKEEADRLIGGSYDWLKDRGEVGKEFCMKMQLKRLQPRTIVEYKRQAFVYPAGNVRVTADSEIKLGMTRNYGDFFNPELPLVSAGNYMILEVKYDEFLPDLIRDLIQMKSSVGSAFSKYAACRLYG
jgi:SPX domain protein involved in polyphosphate accumulation